MIPRKEFIEYEIKRESAEGIHTFTMCGCGRQGCRFLKCLKCWEEELKELQKS